MSHYDYDDETPRRRSHRKSRPVYEEEIIERRTTKPKDSGQMQLVRRRDSEESVEEVRRDFPPGDGTYIQRRTTTRDRYGGNRRRSAEYDYDEEDYYESRRSAPRRSHRHDRRYEAESESESPSPHRRRKSFSEQALAAIGLGGGAAAAAASRKNREKEKDRERDRDYDDRRDRNRSRGRRDSDEMRSERRSKSVDSKGGLDHKQKIMQAAKAAIAAGAIEAFRSRKEPGGFAGQGKRILTAAIGAAGIDGAIDRGEDHKTRHTIEAALGGLAGNRLINGARESSRSRSRVRDGKSDIGGIASAAGLAAIAGKAFNDYRSKSRGRQDSRDRDGSPDRRPRSRSVSDYIQRGVDGAMAKLGLSQPKDDNRGRDQARSRGRYDSEDDDYRARPRGGGAEEPEKRGGSSSSSSSSGTDSYDSDKEIKKQKKIKKRTFITAGLASVATIHAVANVHGSMEKAKERHKKVLSGKMTEAEAKKKKSKALLQDAAAVGIAAIGIQSAFSELKELKEGREEYVKSCKRFEEKRQHRRAKQTPDKPSDHSDDDSRDYKDRPHSDEGTYYYDDNPYGARNYPPPPMSSVPYRDSRDRYYR